MAIYRNIQMSFWTDRKVSEELSADEKYIFLYLMTNPHTNLAGCYEVGKKTIAKETGLSQKRVESVIELLKEKNIIDYCENTSEIYIKHWYKYNWTTSEKFCKPLIADITDIKCEEFKKELLIRYKNKKDSVSIPYQYGSDTTVTDTVINNNDIVTNNDKLPTGKFKKSIERIIDHLNKRTGKTYKSDTKETERLLKARLKDFTEQDCIAVIDNQCDRWLGDDDMEQYLRPQTLFAASKFEGYLNAPPTKKKKEQALIRENINRAEQNITELKAKIEYNNQKLLKVQTIPERNTIKDKIAIYEETIKKNQRYIDTHKPDG